MKTVTRTRKMVVCAVMSAISTILMFLEFPVPVMPPFIKFDFSDLPALIASFSLGPVWGAVVCLIRNLINLTNTYSLGVGELANFLMSASFAFTAGLIYKLNKCRKNAVIGSVAGAVASAVISFPVNYFITYPVYAKILLPIEQILKAYESISGMEMTLAECLIIFNLPFTLIKGLVIALITMLIYKRLSPLIKGK